MIATYTEFAYDTRGRRTSVTDANGKAATYAYDDADRLISVTDAQSPSAGDAVRLPDCILTYSTG